MFFGSRGICLLFSASVDRLTGFGVCSDYPGSWREDGKIILTRSRRSYLDVHGRESMR